jgi:hypothetical protein
MMMMMTNPVPDHQSHQQSPQSIADYLAQLLKDRKQLAALPNVFTHLERLLDEGESHLAAKNVRLALKKFESEVCEVHFIISCVCALSRSLSVSLFFLA